MREADKNRIKRAIEHMKAAVTNLKSIKAVDRTEKMDMTIFNVEQSLYRWEEKLNNLTKID